MSKKLTNNFYVNSSFNQITRKRMAKCMNRYRHHSKGFLHILKNLIERVLNDHLSIRSGDYKISLDLAVFLLLFELIEG